MRRMIMLVGFLIAAGGELPFPLHPAFSVQFEEKVIYPAFGEEDTFAGRFSFQAPDRIYILVIYPETQQIWVQGDTAYIQVGNDHWKEITPLRPGLFLAESYDSLWKTSSGYAVFFGSQSFPGVDQAVLHVDQRGKPESLRVETQDALLHFRFYDFQPSTSIPSPPSGNPKAP